MRAMLPTGRRARTAFETGPTRSHVEPALHPLERAGRRASYLLVVVLQQVAYGGQVLGVAGGAQRTGGRGPDAREVVAGEPDGVVPGGQVVPRADLQAH